MDYEKEYKEALKRAKIWQEHLYEIGDKDYADELNYIFYELKESEDERIRKELLEHCKNQAKPYIQTGNKCPQIQSWIDWLEKQGKQEINDEDTIQSYSFYSYKGKPDFKVGDWIVDNCGYTWKIEEILNQFYILEDVEGGESRPTIEWVDKTCHLWTIQDAKDGDVLFHSDSASNGIFIFKELLKYDFSEKVICYCDYDSEDHFCLGEHHTCCWTNAKILHPATKEQRDLLFQKMKEAGYMWDANKKELKKIEPKPAIEMKTPEESLGIDSETYNKIVDECVYGEQKPIIEDKPLVIDEGKSEMDYCFTKMMNGEKVSSDWNEEDEEMWIDAIKYLELFDAQGIHGDVAVPCIKWLKSIKEKVIPQPKQEWSADDYSKIQRICKYLDEAKEYYADITEVRECIDWLKSFKPQSQWKPSEEQMQALSEALSLAKNCGEESAFDLRVLYEQLKKLKEE